MTRENFLDMVIQDSGNSDGVTLVINGASMGNFGKDWDMARKWAVRWYMVLRPAVFGHSIMRKLNVKQSGTYGEWLLFASQVKKDFLVMPDGLAASKCGNSMITFNGEII